MIFKPVIFQSGWVLADFPGNSFFQPGFEPHSKEPLPAEKNLFQQKRVSPSQEDIVCPGSFRQKKTH